MQRTKFVRFLNLLTRPDSSPFQMKPDDQPRRISRVTYRRSLVVGLLVSAIVLSLLSGCASAQQNTKPGQNSNASTANASATAPAATTSSSGNSQATALQKFSYSFTSSFDTAITIIGYDESQANFDRLAKAAEAKFLEYHQLYDIYHEYPGINNIMTLNKNAGKGPVKVDPRIIDLLEFYLGHDALAPGKVNVALGAVLAIWHDHRTAAESGQGTVPDLQSLQTAALHSDPATVKIDRAASTVELTDPLTQLDVGAVGKGYATEAVAQYLKSLGMTSGIVSAGGSNVRLIGKPADPARKTWAIGIQNPFISMMIPSDNSLDVIETNDTSIVTSGDYQRYYMVDGVIYHHLIDPATLMPARYMRAVTIMIADSGLADYLSTTVFLMPYEEGRKLVESIPGCEALWILDDGSIKLTDGMLAVLKDKGQANAIEAAQAITETTK
jgi:thiamine biosynthesis lipoprotein